MATTFRNLDPWGPLSAILYETNDYEFVLNTIAKTGIPMHLPQLREKDDVSAKTRIRAVRSHITNAIERLTQQERGTVLRILARHIWEREPQKLSEALAALGWAIENGDLQTQDALLSEEFFPAGTPFDAYVSIRTIIHTAKNRLLILDNFIGSPLLTVLRTMPAVAAQVSLSIDVLTTQRGLVQRPDFLHEAKLFQAQFTQCGVDVRTTTDFHDRFIVIDGSTVYHLGASIKDAGTRAFLISKLQDGPVIAAVAAHAQQAWNSGIRRPL
jgi:hypothetical protein